LHKGEVEIDEFLDWAVLRAMDAADAEALEFVKTRVTVLTGLNEVVVVTDSNLGVDSFALYGGG
jgi:hypothetical protein